MTIYEVASPCINQCKLDKETKRCTGCERTLEEVASWSSMSNEAKQAVMDRLAQSDKPVKGE